MESLHVDLYLEDMRVVIRALSVLEYHYMNFVGYGVLIESSLGPLTFGRGSKCPLLPMN